MSNCKRLRLLGAICLIVIVISMHGCAGGGETLVETGGQTLPQEVTTEYLLTTAGFTRLAVNDQTPKRQALLNSIPPGKLVTYSRNGEVYHAYGDEGSQVLYIGDEVAYQNYLRLAGKRKFCERIPGTNQVEFWGCMQEYHERGPKR